MKVVKRLLEKKLHRIVTVDEIKYGSMSERGAFDAVFILRRLQEDSTNTKQVYLFSRPRESFCLQLKESVGMWNEEERNTRSFG